MSHRVTFGSPRKPTPQMRFFTEQGERDEHTSLSITSWAISDHAATESGRLVDDELASLRQQGLDLVVSLLADEEVRELELDGEQEACARSGLQFMRFPVSDRDVPLSPSEVSKLVATLIAELQAGRSVGIHCRIGIGRSAVLAVCVLAGLGVHIEKAWEMVQRSRGLTVPDTSAQRAWPSAWFATEKHANCRTRIHSSVSTDPGKNGLSDFQ